MSDGPAYDGLYGDEVRPLVSFVDPRGFRQCACPECLGWKLFDRHTWRPILEQLASARYLPRLTPRSSGQD